MSRAQLRQTPATLDDLNARLTAVELVLEAMLPFVCERDHACGAKLKSLASDMRQRRQFLDTRFDDRGRTVVDQMIGRVETYVSRVPPTPEP